MRIKWYWDVESTFYCFLNFFFVFASPFFSCSTDEMKTFAGQQIEPLFQFSWLVVFLTLLLCGSVAVVLGFTVNPKLAIAVSLSLLALLYIFFGEETDRLEYWVLNDCGKTLLWFESLCSEMRIKGQPAVQRECQAEFLNWKIFWPLFQCGVFLCCAKTFNLNCKSKPFNNESVTVL